MKEKNKKEKLAFELELAKADLETAHYFQSILRKTTLFLVVLCVLSVVFGIKFLALLLIPALLSLAIIAKSNVNFSKDALYEITAIEAELGLAKKREGAL